MLIAFILGTSCAGIYGYNMAFLAQDQRECSNNTDTNLEEWQEVETNTSSSSSRASPSACQDDEDKLYSPGIITAFLCGYFMGLAPVAGLFAFMAACMIREALHTNKISDIVHYTKMIGIIPIIAMLPVSFPLQLVVGAGLYITLSPYEQPAPTIGPALNEAVNSLTEAAGLAMLWTSDLLLHGICIASNFISSKFENNETLAPIQNHYAVKALGEKVFEINNSTSPILSSYDIPEGHPGTYMLKLLDRCGTSLTQVYRNLR